MNTLTPQILWMTIGGIIACLIGLAAVITAISVIWTKALKPLRDRFDEKIFSPIEEATKKVIDINDTLHRIETRVFDVEGILKEFDLKVFADRVEVLSIDSAYSKFKLRLHSQYSRKAIFILDEKGECEFVNPALCELMHADSSDLERSNWLKRVVISERQLVENEWKDAYSRRRKFDMEQTVIIKGVPKIIHVQAEPFIYNDVVKKFFGVIRLSQ